ncbi:MAG: HAD hydrolase-like protein [Proteobacteria bacterium]|nr:HAD hydrolase-like protein [Pseudomonadota bacterium]
MVSDGWVFDAYETARPRLPQLTFTNTTRNVNNLSEIADHFDTFLLDGFGVLNVGDRAVPGAVARVAELRALGKRVLLVTNSASASRQNQVARYKKRGFDFRIDDIISSREPALTAIAQGPEYKWGLVADPAYGCDGIAHLDGVFLGDDSAAYDSVDAFLMLGCTQWTKARQEILVQSIRSNPRPVFVGNPDIAALLESGISRQPGHFAHRLADATGIAPQFFGKPFLNIFDYAFTQLDPDFDRDRTIMVGDSLHTDILGGRGAGVKTALVTDFGTLAGMDVKAAINTSGIIPDYIMPGP